MSANAKNSVRTTIFTYSATGNTSYLADALEEGLRAEGAVTKRVDMLDTTAEDFDWSATDRAVFAFPVMIFRPPLVARRFLEELAAPPRELPAYLLITSGGMPANSTHSFAVELAANKLNVDAALHIKCEDSYIPFRKWFGFLAAKGKPDNASANAARAFAVRVLSKPRGAPEGITPNSFNPFHYIGKGAQEDAGKLLLGPRSLDKKMCTSCNLCVKDCPAEALAMDGEQGGGYPKANLASCVGCCACFNNCPTGAWELERFEPKWFYKPRR